MTEIEENKMNEVGARKKIQNPDSPHQIRALHRLPACGQPPPRCCLIQLGEGWTCSSPSSWVSVSTHTHDCVATSAVLTLSSPFFSARGDAGETRNTETTATGLFSHMKERPRPAHRRWEGECSKRVTHRAKQSMNRVGVGWRGWVLF